MRNVYGLGEFAMGYATPSWASGFTDVVMLQARPTLLYPQLSPLLTFNPLTQVLRRLFSGVSPSFPLLFDC